MAAEVGTVQDMVGHASPGPCAVCGRTIQENSAFVNTGPTNWNDPSASKTRTWVAAEHEIHGWTPFVVAHPACFEEQEGSDALAALIDAAKSRKGPPRPSQASFDHDG